MEKPPATIFRVEVEGNSFPPKRRQISKRLHGVMSKKTVTTNRTSNLAKQIRNCAVYVNTALKLGGWETYISTQSQGGTNTVSSHWICWRGTKYKATVHKAITWSGQTREKKRHMRMLYIDCVVSHRNTEGGWMIPGVACVLITVRNGFILPSITWCSLCQQRTDVIRHSYWIRTRSSTVRFFW